MDLVPLIDRFGEPATAAIIGLGLGLVFGVVALLSGFCTRSAVLDVTRRERDGRSLALWLVAFAVAIGGTQILLATGQLNVTETRFFATAQSLSGAVIGGSLFGIGMVLARGCTSRLLVLASAGNIRALSSIAVIAVISWLTFQGGLVPLRNMIGRALSSGAIGTNHLGMFTSVGPALGLILGAVLAVFALLAVLRVGLSMARIFQGLVVGALIPAGWWLTHQLSQQVFEPIQAESLSFMRPLANTVNFGASGGAADYVSVDTGLIAGTIIGALLAATVTGRFRIETFRSAGSAHPVRYLIGSLLMGFGGILAVGCTIGAGFTGGSVLAISSLIGLASMVLAGAITDIVVDRSRMPHSSITKSAVAAE